MIIGRIDVSKFVEILSGPELFLLFSYLKALFIILEVIFAKTKFSSVPCDKKSENCFFSALNSSIDVTHSVLIRTRS